MALRKCAECGNSVSDTAAACPHCGAPAASALGYVSSPTTTVSPPAKKKGGFLRTLLWIVGGFFAFSVLSNIFLGSRVDDSKGASTTPSMVGPAAEEFQAKRATILAKANADFAAGDFDGVVRYLARYRDQPDPELRDLYQRSRKQALLARLDTTPKGDAQARFQIYAQLASLDPASVEYKNQRDSLRVQAAEQRAAARNRVLGKMDKQVDEIQHVTFYVATDLPTSKRHNGFYLYISQGKGEPPGLRLKAQYSADDWLFIQRVIVAADEARFTFGRGTWERDNDTRIYEWVDVPATDDDLQMMKTIARAKKVTVRFEGRQYYNDWEMPASAQQAILDTLAAYQLLGGK